MTDLPSGAGPYAEAFAAIAALGREVAPADVPVRNWARFLADVTAFAGSRWPAIAAAAGWQAAELVGCDPARPWGRLDRCGLLWLLDGSRIAALDVAGAVVRTPTGSDLRWPRWARLPPRLAMPWQLFATAAPPARSDAERAAADAPFDPLAPPASRATLGVAAGTRAASSGSSGPARAPAASPPPPADMPDSLLPMMEKTG